MIGMNLVKVIDHFSAWVMTTAVRDWVLQSSGFESHLSQSFFCSRYFPYLLLRKRTSAYFFSQSLHNSHLFLDFVYALSRCCRNLSTSPISCVFVLNIKRIKCDSRSYLLHLYVRINLNIEFLFNCSISSSRGPKPPSEISYTCSI